MLNKITKQNFKKLDWNQVLYQVYNKLKNASDNPRFEAEQIVLKVVRKDSLWLVTHGNEATPFLVLKKINKLVRKVLKSRSFFYALKHCSFYGYEIDVNENVLVPRPETEILVQKAINRIKQIVNISQSHLEQSEGSHRAEMGPSSRLGLGIAPANHKSRDTNHLRILDVGTGSGAIAIALGKYCSENNINNVKIVACDISRLALKVARKNVEKHSLDNIIELKQSNLLSNINDKFDIITANLPYLKTSETAGLPDPKLALIGGPKGSELIQELLTQIKRQGSLFSDGAIFLEIGHDQALYLRKHTEQIFTNTTIAVTKDIAGLDRVVSIYLDKRS